MSRIAFVAPPAAGRLHPILAVARRVARDHDVIVASSPAARARIEGAGLRAHDLGGVRGVRVDFAAFCDRERPDLVIADAAIPVAGPVAAERGIPLWSALSSHRVPEARDDPLGRARHVRRAIVRAARDGLSGTSFSSAGSADRAYSSDCVLALGFRELGFDARIAPAVRFVGPGYYSPVPYDATRPVFGSGANVLVTLGTHVPWFRERMATATHATARRLRHVTFHFSAGDFTGTRVERDDNYMRLPYVRYRTEISRYDLVVHHAGAGVANECLRAGVPAIVFPLDDDHVDIAARLGRLGLARRLADVRRMPVAIRSALADDGLRAACRAFARIADGYDAPETVARLLERFFRTSAT